MHEIGNNSTRRLLRHPTHSHVITTDTRQKCMQWKRNLWDHWKPFDVFHVKCFQRIFHVHRWPLCSSSSVLCFIQLWCVIDFAPMYVGGFEIDFGRNWLYCIISPEFQFKNGIKRKFYISLAHAEDVVMRFSYVACD